MRDLTIVLLAGGRATRLPGKLSLPIGNEPMLLRVFRRMRGTGYPCVLSLREPLDAQLRQQIDVPVAYDSYQDVGPLGGLATAAARVTTPLMFAAAADLPNLDADAIGVLLRSLEIEERAARKTPQAVVPRHADGRIEPLAALYETKALLASAQRALRAGDYRVNSALADLHVLHYDIPADQESRYLNVNTAADLAKANAV